MSGDNKKDGGLFGGKSKTYVGRGVIVVASSCSSAFVVVLLVQLYFSFLLLNDYCLTLRRRATTSTVKGKILHEGVLMKKSKCVL